MLTSLSDARRQKEGDVAEHHKTVDKWGAGSLGPPRTWMEEVC